MFWPTDCRRGFPRQPGPWQAGPPPRRPYGPEDTWDEVPQRRRGRGQWCSPWLSEPRPSPGPADFYGNKENRGWPPHDRSPPRHWDHEEYDQGPEPWSCDPRPFPGPADNCGNEEYRGWAPDDWSAPCFSGDRDDRRPEERFGEGWHPEMTPPGPDCSAWPEFHNEEQHPPWPPAHRTGERGGFQDGCGPWGFRGRAGRRCQRLRRGYRELTVVPRSPCLWPRGYRPPSQSSPFSGTSQPVVKEEPQSFDPSQPLISVKAGARSRERPAKGRPAAGLKVPKCPRATRTPQKSLGTDPQAVTEAVEPEQAAGEMLVGDQPSPGAPLEVEPCSQSSPEAGAGSCPCSPTAPPEPAEPCQDQQCKAEAASAEVPPGGTTEPSVEPREASAHTCTKPDTSAGTQHPPGSSEVKPAAGGCPELCSSLPKPSPACTDLRSAAVLARKEKIELSYQQFSLTIAVVATMLLQKEPSMEAVLGLALRANLRQGRIHHLQELEDFINSYDSATLSS